MSDQFGVRRPIDVPDIGPQLVVEVGFIPLGAVFGAVINTRDARHGVEQRVQIKQIPLIPQGGTGALDVVIIHKVEQMLAAEERPRRIGKQTGHGVLDLKQVVRIERREHTPKTLVVGNGIQTTRTDVLLEVVVVDNLSDKEEIPFLFVYGAAQQLHEPLRQKIAHVQAQPVDIKGVDPEAHRVHEIVLYVLIFQTELDKFGMSFPVFIVEPVVIAGISPKVDVEPEAVVGPLPFFQHFPEGRERPAHMVEHPVQHHTDACRVQLFHESGKFLIGAQTPVHLIKIHRIVAVPLALKERVEQDCADAELLDTGNLRLDEPQTVTRFAKVVLALRTAKPQRIDLIKHTFVKPHFVSSPFYSPTYCTIRFRV